jgi:ATP-binding cassette subfamily F protein 3
MRTPNNLLQLQNASKSFGSRSLFENATFSINENEHVGVIGPNGAGKTTLFKLLAGEMELDAGEVVRSRQLSLGYLKQHDTWDESQSIEEFLSQGTKTPIWDLKSLGRGLGLTEAQFATPLKSLSGGYKMRAKLLHLLGEQPNLMMLDEPTNYLDLETLLVLEEFLQSYEGAFLLISHDREFLRRTTDHILEIENGEFVKYSGNIDDYFEQKSLLREQLEKTAASQAARQKQVLDFAARFGAKASKARQVQSRLKQLSKMETIELKALPVGAKIRIPDPHPTGRLCVEIKDATLGYPERSIVHRVNLNIERGDRIGVVGYNGAGKSTFLKSLAQELPLKSGQLQLGYQVTCSYYAQHVSSKLDPNDTVLSALSRVAHTQIKQQEISDLAGALLFSGDSAKKKISVLSGGEKARVALGQILLQKSPLLLLDEPTNHLDFYTVEALTQALEQYSGTVVFVSHDRGFVRRVATKILEVRNGSLRLYPGSYEEYVWAVQKAQHLDHESLESSDSVPSPSTSSSEEELIDPKSKALLSYHREKIKSLEAERRQCEKTMSDLDKKIKIIESRMAEQGAELSKAQGSRAAEISKELSLAQRKLSELETAFLEQVTKKEELSSQIDSLKEGA